MDQNEIMKTVSPHVKKLEVIQWAIVNGVISLMYSEFIRRMRSKTSPVPIILIPEIQTIHNLLKRDGPMVTLLSKSLIYDMATHPLTQRFINCPELVLFTEEYIDLLNLLLDHYIVPNLCKWIPESISNKFNLQDKNQQTFWESNEIDLFDGKYLSVHHYEYIAEQCVLQLLCILPSIQKDIYVPEENLHFVMRSNEILCINHDNAICPIYFTPNVFSNEDVSETLLFVTSTEIIEDEDVYSVKTNPFNKVSLIILE